MSGVRLACGGLGLAAGLWGLRLLLSLDLADLLAAGLWLAGGVVVHDFVLAPAVLAVGALLVARLPGAVRATVTAALVVVGLVTAAVLPTLGRFGAKPDDPYLLNRPYAAWWLAFVAVTGLVAAGSVWRRRAGRRPRDGAAPVRRT